VGKVTSTVLVRRVVEAYIDVEHDHGEDAVTVAENLPDLEHRFGRGDEFVDEFKVLSVQGDQ